MPMPMTIIIVVELKKAELVLLAITHQIMNLSIKVMMMLLVNYLQTT